MISKAWQTRLRALQQKKYRQEYASFFVEGAKSVLELLASDFEVEQVFATESFCKENERAFTVQRVGPEVRVEFATANELVRAGTFTSNNAGLAVAKTKKQAELVIRADEWVLMLDDIRDPGNLGTILRVADWYGLTKIICSETTADFYNPKVLTASMGSFTRVSAWYGSLDSYLRQHADRAIFGTFLNGENLHTTQFPASGFLVIGNESQGISAGIETLITHRITIPRFGGGESLNAGIATAVVLDNLVRRAD
ncbi:MAG: RNA methyltransferase [Cytophagaceae bacterium]|nr:RNA methyltransferase [Cytophagaceae bacterium]